MKKTYLILLLILIGAFFVRMYKFSAPIADWHSWRQADTSAVSKNFIKFGFDLLHPKYDDLSKTASLLDNPQGYRFVEFPVYNVLQAGLFKTFDHFTLEEWGRLITIFTSLLTIVFLYFLVEKYTSSRVGLFTAFFYAFIPYDIFYGRVILPDPFMVMTLIGGIYFFSQYLDSANKKKIIYYLLSVILVSMSFLIKPFVAYYVLPFAYLIYEKDGIKGFLRWDLWVFLIFSILPLGLWRVWMSRYPEGIPQSYWLFNGTKIRFKPAYFEWIFANRIGELILGYWGVIFLVFGLMVKPFKKEKWFFLSFMASSLIYLFSVATGNVEHDYYQILIMPTIVIFLGKGLDGLLRAKDVINYKITIIVAIVCVVFMLGFAWFVVRDYYDIDHPDIITAGEAVDAIVPDNAKVIAPYGGDTTFLYFVNRQGWPVWDRSLKDFIKAGANYIVFVDPTPSELNFQTLFKPVVINKTYALFDLGKPTPAGLLEEKK